MIKKSFYFFLLIIVISSCDKDGEGINPPVNNGGGQPPPPPPPPPPPYTLFNNIIPGAQTVGYLSEPGGELSAAVCNDKFYYAAYDHVDVFDPATGVLVRQNINMNRFTVASISCGNKVFFAGGLVYSSTAPTITARSRVDIYNTSTGVWDSASLSVARYNISAFCHNNKIFFAGGSIDPYTASKSIDIYDATTNSWSITELPSGYNAAITNIGNEIWFAIPGTNKIDIYDTRNNTWRTETAGDTIFGSTAITINNKIYFTGGSIVNVYDISANTWSRLVLTENRWSIPVALSNNKIAFIGGMTSWFVYSKRIDVYDPAANTWSYLYMSHDLFYEAIISYNNYIYSAGGLINEENNTLKEIYRFSL